MDEQLKPEPQTTEPSEIKPELPDAKSDKRKPEKQTNSWLTWGRDIVICLILVLLFRANVAEANYIPSPSMEPTLHISDRIIVDKISKHWRPLQRGDMVVFHPPLENREAERWIKRVVGLPGETVEVLNGSVYVDGEKLNEPYIEARPYYSDPIITLKADDPATSENEGEYFLLGDNRRNSRDSHIWGPCPAKNIIGRAIFRYWPLNAIGGFGNSKATESEETK